MGMKNEIDKWSEKYYKYKEEYKEIKEQRKKIIKDFTEKLLDKNNDYFKEINCDFDILESWRNNGEEVITIYVTFYTKKGGRIKLLGDNNIEVYDKVDKTDILKAYEIFEEVF